MATERGPLCDEPLFGVNVKLEVHSNAAADGAGGDGAGDGAGEEQYGPFSGQVISAAREAIRQAVLKAGAYTRPLFSST
jgi:ribosome assembly protein 1